MRWVLDGQDGPATLQNVSGLDVGEPGPGEVRLLVSAASLNYRDILIYRGLYPMPVKQRVVPGSDGAGTIVAVGAGVKAVSPGDRVMTNFFVDWAAGGIRRDLVQTVLGSVVDGVLADEVILPAGAVMPIPAALSFADASTLPCAGVTAWNALFHTAGLVAGDTVLLQGTGGVSSFALQFAKARGIRVIQTSSSDAKLAAAKARGADELIIYGRTPDWDVEVLRLTDGEGVDAVIEVGGAGTLERSIRSTRMGGTILDPIIDRTFSLEQAPDAFAYLEAGPGTAGKVVVTLAPQGPAGRRTHAGGASGEQPTSRCDARLTN